MGDRAGTDWEARFQASREPQVKVLEKSFAGIPAGARMLVVTPRIVGAAVCDIAPGAVMAPAKITAIQHSTSTHMRWPGNGPLRGHSSPTDHCWQCGCSPAAAPTHTCCAPAARAIDTRQ